MILSKANICCFCDSDKKLPAQTHMPHTSEHSLGNLAKGMIFLGITGFDSQSHHVQLLSCGDTCISGG